MEFPQEKRAIIAVHTTAPRRENLNCVVLRVRICVNLRNQHLWYMSGACITDADFGGSTHSGSTYDVSPTLYCHASILDQTEW